MLDNAMPLSSAVGLGVITWKPKNADRSKYECICSPFPEGALISKLLKVSVLNLGPENLNNLIYSAENINKIDL